MDFFAIATQGFYPIPTPTVVKRMAFAASYGYLDTLYTPAVDDFVPIMSFIFRGRG